MNEKLQYAEMLEIPVNTCSITFKPSKKKRGRKKAVDAEKVKEQLLHKINAQSAEESVSSENDASVNADQDRYATDSPAYENAYSDDSSVCNVCGTAEAQEDIREDYVSTVNIKPLAKKKRGKFGIIAVQLCVVGALIATIFLTNAFVPDSGINTFMKSVFGSASAATADERTYSEFKPNLLFEVSESATVEDGIVTFSGKGSLYSPCDGKITLIETGEDGKFTIEISHSENFKTVFKGVDYAYVSMDDTVYSNIPVGYLLGEEATMCFYGEEGNLITDYSVENNSVIWAV